ncbi:Gamma-glutamyl cyclotransferase, AIG2-like [Halomicrobium zhouii]|uniref:Gamma-glutamyl cyclotransferase, AIG2-like n=1 Tax=Halomicrobium zhouii TaxID=767519 RepID=A0A1I6M8T0_9EURY|nr:gamma-glutamylcyclotransferase family protein [Halomicrobium zhouii]SFS12028.1 Gamma-glutamyl cyclotransferase, AIG2-like [Halomicrobium zhouii]
MHVFVYGTLCDPDTASGVLDDFAYEGPATLDGLHRVDGEYPTLAPGGEVDGRIIVTDDVAALDRYEGVDRGLYVRVPIPHADGGTVQTYVGDPERLGASAAWPGEGPFRERVRACATDEDVLVHSSP